MFEKRENIDMRQKQFKIIPKQTTRTDNQNKTKATNKIIIIKKKQRQTHRTRDQRVTLKRPNAWPKLQNAYKTNEKSMIF